MNGRAALVKKLGDLLGFDDGAEDVLDHLLTIESNQVVTHVGKNLTLHVHHPCLHGGQDLVDYLAQLLGDESEQIRDFADDVGRFHRGDSRLTGSTDDDDKKGESSPSVAAPRQEEQGSTSSTASSTRQPAGTSTATLSKLPQQRQQQEDNKGKHTTTGKSPNRQKQKQQRQTNQKKKGSPSRASAAPPVSNAKKSPPSAAGKRPKDPPREPTTSSHELASSSTPRGSNNASGEQHCSVVSPSPPPPAPEKKSHPARGKAPYVCGCYGTLHKPLTNCLFCGRISCEVEGYNFCPFCGHMVEEVKPPAGNEDQAWLHKERLLRYDREFARRTVILDDQEDYFTSQSSAWLTADERAQAREKEQEERQQKHHRGKIQLDLSL